MNAIRMPTKKVGFMLAHQEWSWTIHSYERTEGLRLAHAYAGDMVVSDNM